MIAGNLLNTNDILQNSGRRRLNYSYESVKSKAMKSLTLRPFPPTSVSHIPLTESVHIK